MGSAVGLSRIVTKASRARRHWATTVGIALALALATASPAAAGLWSAPANISQEGQSARAPHVVVDAAGDAVAVWARSDGSNDVVQAAVKPVGEPWGKPVTLSAAGEEASEPEVAVNGAGEAVAVWARSNGSNDVVQAAVEGAGEAWGKPVTLSEAGEEASNPEVAVDAAGDAVAVWARSNGSNDVVQAALKPVGEPWGSTAILSAAGQDAHTPEVAVDAAGEAVAVWVRSNGSNDVVQAAVKPPGAPWATPTTVSAAGQEASQPQIAVDAAGDATAVWTHFVDLSAGGMSNYVVEAASKPAGAVWEAQSTISEEGQEEGFEPQVAVDAAGDATAVWTRFIYGCCRLVEAAEKQAGEHWGAPSTLESGGDARVAVNADGDAAAVWTRYYGPGDLVQSAVKVAGEPWGKPATVSEDESSAPAIALDAAGDATALWTRYIGFGFGNFIVQAAQYKPATAFTIETLQKLSSEPAYTKAELNGKVGETVDYKIVVKNTGSKSLNFAALKDSACEGIAPAGTSELEAQTEETFTCTHKLTSFVSYSSEASIEGNEGTGTRTSNRVTVALAPVYEAPAGAADSANGTCVESRASVFTCSNLRAALASAKSDSTVKLEPGAYQLGEAHGYPSGPHAFLEITAGLTIQGAGPGATTIEQTDGRDPVFVIPYDAGFSQIDIQGVKLTGGVAAGGDGEEPFGWEQGGGALRIDGSGAEASSVTLTDDLLTGNLAHAKNAKGGAIFNKRTLNIFDSTIAHNTALAEGASSNTELGDADGGGIFNLGHLLIAGSTIIDNTVEAGGKQSSAMGGGVDSGVENFTSEATAAIANTTITGNTASAGTTVNPPLVYGGGLAIDDGLLSHVTLYANTASPVNAWESWGGNIYEPQNGGGAWINNSIVADGSASNGPNCMFTSFGSNPEDNRDDLDDGPAGECGFTLAFDPLVDVPPQLMPLADNGGPTETFAPKPGSPAIGAGSECAGGLGDRSSAGWATAIAPLDVDQRGMPRNGHCDIGAFQTEPPFAATSPQISGAAEQGQTLTCTPGVWSGEGTLAYSYEWLRDGASTGDHATSYTVLPGDVERQISCLVTVAGTYGTTEAASPSLRVRADAPTVVPGVPSSITQTTATLNATVNPNGGNVTKCEFEYGATVSETKRAACGVPPGAGESAVAVSAAITGLAPSTTYHVRILATNSGGTNAAAGEPFTTLPSPPKGGTAPAPTTQSGPQEAAAPATGILGAKETLPYAKVMKTTLAAGSQGTLNLELECPAGASNCSGTITLKTLTALGTATVHHTNGHKVAILTVAVASFKVTGGHLATIKLHLSRAASALLLHGHSLRVRATIVARGANGSAHTTQTILTIRAAKTR